MQNTKTIDLTETLNEYIYYAEEFAERMENMYDEPNEYSTSLHESLKMSLSTLIKLYAQKDIMKSVKIIVPVNFMELINDHKCGCSLEEWNRFTSLFNQCTVVQ